MPARCRGQVASAFGRTASTDMTGTKDLPCNGRHKLFSLLQADWTAAEETRAVVEGRFLSMRAHARELGVGLPSRILATGGGSKNNEVRLTVCVLYLCKYSRYSSNSEYFCGSLYSDVDAVRVTNAVTPPPCACIRTLSGVAFRSAPYASVDGVVRLRRAEIAARQVLSCMREGTAPHRTAPRVFLPSRVLHGDHLRQMISPTTYRNTGGYRHRAGVGRA